MGSKRAMEFKIEFLKSSIMSCWFTNCIANGGCYYLFNHTAGDKSAVGFVINAVVTAFVLSLICAACASLSVTAKYKRGNVPERAYERDGHLLIHFFPRGVKGQVFACAVVVTLLFAFISGGTVIICGFAGGVPVIPGMVMHGILAGCMGMTNMYLMCAARLSSFEEEKLIQPASQEA